jgi:hypothetical protein
MDPVPLFKRPLTVRFVAEAFAKVLCPETVSAFVAKSEKIPEFP